MLAEDRLANLLIIREKMRLWGGGRQVVADAVKAIDQKIEDACRTMAETLKREGVDGGRPEVVYILFDANGSRTFRSAESVLERLPTVSQAGRDLLACNSFRAAITASDFRPGHAASVTIGDQAYHVFAAQPSWLPGAT